MSITDYIIHKLKYHTDWGILFYGLAAFDGICLLGTLGGAHETNYWLLWILGEALIGAILLALGAIFHERYHFVQMREYRKTTKRRKRVNRRVQEIKRQRIACEQVAAEARAEQNSTKKDDTFLPKFLMIAP